MSVEFFQGRSGKGSEGSWWLRVFFSTRKKRKVTPAKIELMRMSQTSVLSVDNPVKIRWWVWSVPAGPVELRALANSSCTRESRLPERADKYDLIFRIYAKFWAIGEGGGPGFKLVFVRASTIWIGPAGSFKTNIHGHFDFQYFWHPPSKHFESFTSQNWDLVRGYGTLI